jgi:hypothetical protein
MNMVRHGFHLLAAEDYICSTSTSIGLLAVKDTLPDQIFPSSLNGRAKTTSLWGLTRTPNWAGADIEVFCRIKVSSSDAV